MMSSGSGIGDIITVSGLAIRVHTAYNAAGDGQILQEVATLQVLVDQVAQHFKCSTISSNDHHDGQRVLKGCQHVLEDLYSLNEKYQRLASTNRRLVFVGVKLGKDNIISLRERLVSNTVLLRGFVQRFVVPSILSYQSYRY